MIIIEFMDGPFQYTFGVLDKWQPYFARPIFKPRKVQDLCSVELTYDPFKDMIEKAIYEVQQWPLGIKSIYFRGPNIYEGWFVPPPGG